MTQRLLRATPPPPPPQVLALSPNCCRYKWKPSKMPSFKEKDIFRTNIRSTPKCDISV